MYGRSVSLEMEESTDTESPETEESADTDIEPIIEVKKEIEEEDETEIEENDVSTDMSALIGKQQCTVFGLM
jgi:hypothetical protein